MQDGNAEEPAHIADLFVRMATERDKGAFSAVFRLVGPKLMQFLTVRANGILPAAVLEEISQEAFAAAWRNSEGFDPTRDDPVGWLFAIARNYGIQALHTQMQQMDAVELLRARVPSPPMLDDNLSARERIQRLHIAVSDLPTDEANLIQDVYLRGMSHTEIAKARGVPVGTIKGQIRRAMGRLRAALAEAEL